MYRLKIEDEVYAEYEDFGDALTANNYLHKQGTNSTVVKVVNGVEYQMMREGKEDDGDVLRKKP